MSTNESDRSLEYQQRHCGEDNTPAEHLGERHCREAIHGRFDCKRIKVVREQPIVNRAENPKRGRAKRDGADDETIGKPLRIVGRGSRHAVSSQLADAIGSFLQPEQLANDVPQDEREEDDCQLFGNATGRTVEANPREPQSDNNCERADDDFEVVLHAGGQLLFNQQTCQRADDNCRDI